MRIFLGAFLLLLPIVPAYTQPTQTRTLESLIQESLDKWGAPGLSVAIVRDGEILYLKGHGLCTIGKSDPITPDTLFPVASCSKTFTSLALAMLADDDKLHWDDLVRTHIPFFHLCDPAADANVTLRDLLTHRTGMGGHEPLWYRAPWPLEDRIRKMGQLPPEHSFRSQFEYQTILYGAAGYAGGKAAGTSWEELVQNRILTPLGMRSSFAVFPKSPPSDVASPHRKNDKIEVIPRYPLESADPAGSVHSTARDLAQFMRFQLGDGTWQGKRLVSKANLDETHMPQIVIRREGYAELMNPRTMQISYGLGWIIQDYEGSFLYLHGGAIDGFRSHIVLVPQAKIGIALLSNLDRGYMNLALSQSIIDLLLKVPEPVEWNDYYSKIYQGEQEELKRRSAALLATRRPGTSPSHRLSQFVGEYVDPAYGICEISLEKETLVWRWSSWRIPLDHFHYDTFLVKNERMESLLVFATGADGSISSLRIFDREFRRKR